MQLPRHAEEKADYKALVFVLVIAVATLTRFFYANEFQYNPFFHNVYTDFDSIHFFMGAQNFAEGDILAQSPSNRFSPLYTYFLGILFKIFGPTLNAVWFMQFALGVVTVLLVFLISLELFNTRSAIFAATLYNFYGLALMYEGILLRASLLTFLGVLSLYLIIQVLKHPKPILIFAAGISISLFIQCRPNVALIFILLPLFYLYPLDRQKLHLFSVIGLISSLFFIPLLIRSWIVHGKFVFFDASGPAAFLVGNHPEYYGLGLSDSFKHPRGLSMGYGEMFSIFINRLIEQPVEMLNLYARKMYFLFSSLEPYNNYDFLLFKQFSPLLNTPLSNFSLISSLVLTGFLFKIGKGKTLNPLYSFMVGGAISVLIFFMVARFRVQIVPYFAVFAGHTLDTLFSWLKQRKWKTSVQMSLFCSLLILLFNIPEYSTGAKQPYTARINQQLGMSLVSHERYSQAIEYLNLYLRSNPDDLPTLKAKALALRGVGDSRRSIMTYQQIASLRTTDAGAHYNLALLYANRGGWEKATLHINLAVREFENEGNLKWLNIAQRQINQF